MGITTHNQESQVKIKRAAELDYLPISGSLKNGREVYIELLDPSKKEDAEDMRRTLNDISEEGIHYPFYFVDQKLLESFYLGHDVFLLKYKDSGEQIGNFYIKSVYPDRTAHLCNSGFGVKQAHRGQGALQFMIKVFLKLARDLGYLGSYFTMVYAINDAALSVYRKMGFQQVGTIPRAGNMKGVGFVDAHQFYYDLTTLDADGCPVGGWSAVA